MDTINSILQQVGKTTININAHAQGHFISTKQYQALLEAAKTSITPDNSGDEAVVRSSSTTAQIDEQVLSLQRDLREVQEGLELLNINLYTEQEAAKRSDLNLRIGRLKSREAKLKKALNVSKRKPDSC